MATFTWIPDIGASEEHTPRIRSVQFGEAYEQRSPAGINPDMVKRSLTFSGRTSTEGLAILAFLAAQGGVTSFDYTHPGDVSRKYVCKTWKGTDTGFNMKTVTCDIAQVPL